MWQPLHQILPHLPLSEPSPEQRQFDRVQQAWTAIVGENIALYTRPIGIQAGVLQVATANAVWAQNLMFQRRQWLPKINQSLDLQLVDLRFSTAPWHQSPPASRLTNSEQLWQQHPYRIEPIAEAPRSPNLPESSQARDPRNSERAFQEWAEKMQAHAQQMLTCPSCHSPATPGELDRWKVCGICMAQGSLPSPRSKDS